MWTQSQAPSVIVPGTATCLFRAVTDGPNPPGRHRHRDLHQFTWAPSDVLVAEFDDAVWTVPRGYAVWVPAGVAHALHGRVRGVECLDLKLHHGHCRALVERPALVAVTSLLASLLDHLADPGVPTGERRRAERVLYDQLRPVRVPGVDVPVPVDPRVRRIADGLRADPADPRGLDEWAVVAGTSARTLDRLVRAAAGTGFRTWRTRIRIAAAVGHIAAGDAVATAARRVGYRQAGTFAEVFRRELGCTPTRFRAQFVDRSSRPAADRTPLVAAVDPG